MMKIAIIAPYDVLSFDSGASRRVFGLASGLNSCGASVYVLHHGATKSLKDNFRFIHFKSCSPLSEASNYFHPLNPYYPSQLLHFLCKYNPDIVQCEQPWSIFPTFFIAKKFKIPCVLDEHNVELFWTLYASKVPFLAPVTFALENSALFSASLILVTSEIDKRLFTKIYKIPEEKIFVVPNGIETNRLLDKLPNKLLLKRKLGLDTSKKIVLFHGVMSAKQNYEAAQLIVDFIAPRINDAVFLIIGKNPPKWLQTKAKSKENVLILGYVPNIEEYIIAAEICIAPIQRGSGTRLKVLEYMAARKPIVATYKAVEGLPVINNIHAFLFKNVDAEFINAIDMILSKNDALTDKISLNARRLAMKFDWVEIGNILYDKYTTLLGNKK